MTALHDLAPLCGVPGGWFPLAMLLAGLAGSGLHCVPMCGPFVLGQTVDRMACLPAGRLCELARLRSALLLPYHGGRLSTYALLGAMAGGIGAPAAGLRWAPPLLLALAGVLFGMQALRRLAPARWHLPWRLPASPWLPRRLAALASRIDRRRWTGGLVLGLLLGFLPCGLLYTALVAATASGGATAGAVAMLAFGLGTVPALLLTALVGHALRRATDARVGSLVGAAVMSTNAAILWLLAWRLLAVPT